ncbi:MAG TPA: hypothetical protein VHZ73_08210 [Vicinamibacterales bacterium]|jgi:hypothetical protein|nr:hypothetical protein [Vicinamibacterales bacterium]
MVAAACVAYHLAVLLYPDEFRRDFGRELEITFRNRVEDVLDTGDVLQWMAFVGHMCADTIRACVTLAPQSGARRQMSLLGLGDDATAYGSLERTVDVQFTFFAAGLVLTCIGWYVFFVALPASLK